MTEENKINANDKINIIYDKVTFITTMIMYINFDKYHFSEDDMAGFRTILSDLQEEVKEVKKLMK